MENKLYFDGNRICVLKRYDLRLLSLKDFPHFGYPSYPSKKFHCWLPNSLNLDMILQPCQRSQENIIQQCQNLLKHIQQFQENELTPIFSRRLLLHFLFCFLHIISFAPFSFHSLHTQISHSFHLTSYYVK